MSVSDSRSDATAMLVALVFLGLLAQPAFGYVRTTSERSGKPLFWGVRCIPMQPDARGSQDLPLGLFQQTLAQAARNWTSQTSRCSSLVIFGVEADGVVTTGADDHHIVTFVEDEWTDNGGIVAKTLVWHIDAPGKPNDGLIVDADIKLNGYQYTFITDAATPARPNTDVADLEGTLTHELGHVMGLNHTCWDESGAQPYDDQGGPVLKCANQGDLPASVTEATMYPYTQPPGTTRMRHVTDDDARGICGPYPSGSNAACFARLQGGCACELGGGGASSWPIAWLGLLFALSYRRATVKSRPRRRSLRR